MWEEGGGSGEVWDRTSLRPLSDETRGQHIDIQRVLQESAEMRRPVRRWAGCSGVAVVSE